MPHKFTIKKIVPWTEFNEYEGHMEGVIDNYDLCCYAQMSSAQEWQQYHPGDILEVDIFLLRYDKVQIVEEFILPTIKQIENSCYEVTGIVTQISGERVLLKPFPPFPFPLKVDLDIHSHLAHLFQDIHIGSQIFLQGLMWMDLYPEEE